MAKKKVKKKNVFTDMDIPELRKLRIYRIETNKSKEEIRNIYRSKFGE